jgi:hypothetical protein
MDIVTQRNATGETAYREELAVRSGVVHPTMPGRNGAVGALTDAAPLTAIS